MEHRTDKRLRRLEALRRDCSPNRRGSGLRLAVQCAIVGGLVVIIAAAPLLGLIATILVLSAAFFTNAITTQRRLRALIDLEIEYHNETCGSNTAPEHRAPALSSDEAATILGVEIPKH